MVEQAQGSPARDVFIGKVLRKNERKLKAYWSKQVFSGKAGPPRQLGDDAAVKAFVASNNSAIGYIDSSQIDDSVKPVLTVK